jgi:hypothetical protein
MATLLERVQAILARHNPNADQVTVQRLCDDIAFAGELAAEPIRPRLKTRPAESLKNAAERLIKIARTYQLASPQQLDVVRRLRRQAVTTLRMPPSSGPDPSGRDWIWPCCLNFLDALPTDPNKPNEAPAVWDWGRLSPALEFLKDCCALVAPGIDESAIRRAKEAYPADASSEEERAAAYERWWAEFEQEERELGL